LGTRSTVAASILGTKREKTAWHHRKDCAAVPCLFPPCSAIDVELEAGSMVVCRDLMPLARADDGRGFVCFARVSQSRPWILAGERGQRDSNIRNHGKVQPRHQSEGERNFNHIE